MKITMPAPLALYLAAAMLAAVSPDELTPIITGVHLSRRGKALCATATDRYRVHEVTLTDAITSGRAHESIILPAPALKWIQRAMRIIAPRHADRKTCTVTITTHETRVQVAITNAQGDTATLGTETIGGNFPPVWTLIDAAEAAEHYTGDVRLNMAFVGKLVALEPDGMPSLIVKPTARKDNPDQPGPLLATAPGDRISVRAMVQPNRLIR